MQTEELQRPLGIEVMERYEKELLSAGATDLPATNYSHDGILLREVFMPAGSYVCGHEHKTSHWNIVVSGKAIVSMNGEAYKVKAGDRFVSHPGVRKGLYIVEDMTWITVHHNPTDTVDNEEIEAAFVDKTEAYYEAMAKLEGGQECLSE